MAVSVSQARNGDVSGVSCAGHGWRPFSSVTCSAWGLGIDRGLQFSLLLTINLHKQSIPAKKSSKASMTGNIQSMKWMLIAWQSSAWKTWNVHYAWSGWALQRRGEIKVWLQYVFLFLCVCVCVQKKGNEPFQWIRCINTAAIILSRFKNVILFCRSVPLLSMNLYPGDNSKGHLEGSLEMGWPGAAAS